ncbi:helix-hairpin-helix domain-containing protein [Micromonospora sp. NPDC051300]|uniref:helix-hairpin-helix domain-containing protein n=1 Tax=Micromonospora sp. NPDC051300 TaxID=3364286 RepID=UPI00378CE6C7
MPSSFGQWLLVILALLIGVGVGWAVFGRRSGADTSTPTVEGAAAPATEVTATVDEARPVAVVDESPAPAAVTDQPRPVEEDSAARLDTDPAGTDREPVVVTAEPEPTTAPDDSKPLTGAESAAAPTPVASEPIDTPEPITAPEPIAVSEPVTAPEPTTAPEPVAVDATPSVDAEPTVEDEPAVDATPTPVGAVSEPATITGTEPAATPVVPAPRSSAENDAPAGTDTPDDFRRIQGIGPKLAAALQEAGIRTYRQLAELDEAALRETVKAAGLRAAPGLATWPQQAKVLAGARAEADRVLPAGAE